jgi:YegS/Rv2252/BmrU family lipid kinase
MPSRRYHVLLNVNSGTALSLGLTPEVLEQRFAAEGHTATMDNDGDAALADRLARAAASGADVVIAAGGDGTVTAVASAVLATGQALAILPLGTANLLARDLHVPLDVDAALTALSAMQPRQIDVGEVNGRIFLHKVVIGLVPAIAKGREQIRHRGDWPALMGFVAYFIRRLTRTRRIAVEIAPRDGERRFEKVQSIAVANNSYDEGMGKVFARERLDKGSLTLYVLRHLSVGDVLRLALEMLLGTWRQDEALEIEDVSAITIRTRRKRVKAMIDGEVETLTVPLNFRIRPAALTVLAPPDEPVGEPESPLQAVGA